MLSNNVTSIGIYSFSDCSNLREIIGFNSIKVIEKGAFQHCSQLQNIYLSKNISSVGDFAFNDCINLTVYCETKKPFFGYPKGYSSNCFKNVKRIAWGFNN